jgi:hypothetical protein
MRVWRLVDGGPNTHMMAAVVHVDGTVLAFAYCSNCSSFVSDVRPFISKFNV